MARLIFGLGNPGPLYASTRHNIGFMVLDQLACDAGGSAFRSRFDALVAETDLNSSKVLLVKPQTYMNLSGRSVDQAIRYYNVDLADVIVVHDDVDLPFGRMKVKYGGGLAGHKGLKSIFDRVGSGDFIRVRVGVGRPEGRMTVADYVLSGFNSEERKLLGNVTRDAADAVTMAVVDGLEFAMNRYNGSARDLTL